MPDYNDMLRVSRRAQKEDEQFAEAMQRLLNNPDFHVYQMAVVGKRKEAIGAMLLDPSDGMDGLVRSEFLKGALYALCLASDLPSVIVQAMSQGRVNSGDEDAS